MVSALVNSIADGNIIDLGLVSQLSLHQVPLPLEAFSITGMPLNRITPVPP